MNKKKPLVSLNEALARLAEEVMSPDTPGYDSETAEARRYSDAAKDLHQRLTLAPIHVYARHAVTDRFLPDETAMERVIGILEHMARWYDRVIEDEVSHERGCRLAGIDPATEPRMMVLSRGRWPREYITEGVNPAFAFDADELSELLDDAPAMNEAREATPPQAIGGRKRSDPLTVLIAEAQQREKDPDRIWAELVKRADTETVYPLVYYDNAGKVICWCRDTGDWRRAIEARKSGKPKPSHIEMERLNIRALKKRLKPPYAVSPSPAKSR